MQLELSEAHTQLLRTLLDRALEDLSYEIADTDNAAFKRDLREKREAMSEVRRMLGS